MISYIRPIRTELSLSIPTRVSLILLTLEDKAHVVAELQAASAASHASIPISTYQITPLALRASKFVLPDYLF
jgi:hypothetical protein